MWKAILFGILIGIGIGVYYTDAQVYHDCRIAGVTRIGNAAFKCEQFSKVIMLTPDEVIKKDVKK